MSVSDYAENVVLDAIFNNVALQKAARYVKLHTGDPGEAGTANAATETTRKSLSNAAASSGTTTSVNDLVWTAVAGTETYTHVSVWDAATVGNCLWVGPLAVSKAVNAGDTFTIPTGSLTISLD